MTDLLREARWLLENLPDGHSTAGEQVEWRDRMRDWQDAVDPLLRDDGPPADAPIDCSDAVARLQASDLDLHDWDEEFLREVVDIVTQDKRLTRYGKWWCNECALWHPKGEPCSHVGQGKPAGGAPHDRPGTFAELRPDVKRRYEEDQE